MLQERKLVCPLLPGLGVIYVIFSTPLGGGGDTGIPAVATLSVSTGQHFRNVTLGVTHVTHASGRTLKTCDSTEENPEPYKCFMYRISTNELPSLGKRIVDKLCFV